MTVAEVCAMAVGMVAGSVAGIHLAVWAFEKHWRGPHSPDHRWWHSP